MSIRRLRERCAGIDVHKKKLVVCAVRGEKTEKRSFGTMTQELHRLADWLEEQEIRDVAIESTGSYWKPVYNVLESRGFEVCVANARSVQAVPGRKTDVCDAEWLAELHQHGLIRGSFIPSREQRELRELVRLRTSFIEERSRTANRIQQVLEGGNIKLGSVATDILGVSGRAILRSLAAGSLDRENLAPLLRGRLKKKHDLLVQALEGSVGPHQRLLIGELLDHVETLDRRIERLDEEVAKRQRPFAETIERLDSIPGIAQRCAEVLLAEIGTDMTRFGTHQRLASWAKICPGNNSTAGRSKSGRTGHGNRHLRSHLLQAARSAGRTRNTFLGARYRRLRGRMPEKKAAAAIAHSILAIAFYVIRDETTYRDLGPQHYDENHRDRVKKAAVRRLQNLGFDVTLSQRAIA